MSNEELIIIFTVRKEINELLEDFVFEQDLSFTYNKIKEILYNTNLDENIIKRLLYKSQSVMKKIIGE